MAKHLGQICAYMYTICAHIAYAPCYNTSHFTRVR